MTSRGSALPGKVISFTINGEAVGSATTDANGVAMLAEMSLDSVRVGVDAASIEARFAGDRGYAGSAATGSLGIN